MVSTRWLQGAKNISEALNIRKAAFEELKLGKANISDVFDDFSFNVVVYEDDEGAGTGRLLFKDGMYFIDNVCVLKEFRGRRYGDLIVRMLIRKAVNMGAEKTYTECSNKCRAFFERIGFESICTNENGNHLMLKVGDVGGHCSN